MAIGQMRDECAFHRLDAVADDYGAPSSGYAADPFLTVFGRLRLERGAERMQAGRMESRVSAVLTVRSSPEVDAITEADQVRVAGAQWQIRTIVNPDRRGRYLEMLLERGAGQG